MMLCRGIGLDAESGEDGREEEECAEVARDQHGAFSLPTEASARGEVAFEDRSGVDVGSLGTSECCEVGLQRAEFGFDEVVVIEIEGIGCHFARGRNGFALSIYGRERDDGLRAWEHIARVSPPLWCAFQPLHLAVKAVSDPGLERVGVRGSVGLGEADGCEAEFAGGAPEGFLPSGVRSVRAEILGDGVHGRCRFQPKASRTRASMCTATSSSSISEVSKVASAVSR